MAVITLIYWGSRTCDNVSFWSALLANNPAFWGISVNGRVDYLVWDGYD